MNHTTTQDGYQKYSITIEVPLGDEVNEYTFLVTEELSDDEEDLLERLAGSDPNNWLTEAWNTAEAEETDTNPEQNLEDILVYVAGVEDIDAARRLVSLSPLAENVTGDEFDHAVEHADARRKQKDAKKDLNIDVTVQNGRFERREESSDGETYYVPVTNFTLSANRFLFIDTGGDEELQIEMEVQPTSAMDRNTTVTVSFEVFNNLQKFRDEVCIGRTTRFDGNQSDLNDIREIVGHQIAPELDGTHQMGIHNGELVTRTGSLTADGWSDEPQAVYVSRGLDQEKKVALSPSTHDEADEDVVAETVELLAQMRNPERWIPVLGWFYSSAFKPWIMEQEGDFNILNVWGETGSGKSKSLNPVWNAFGMGDGNGPLKAKGTTFPIMASMSLTNSMPMWLDEFKPSDMTERQRKDVMEILRNVTTGGTASRGNADLSSEVYNLRAPVVVSGEQGISGPAEGRRIIKTMFRKDTVEETSCVRAFKRLTGSSYYDDEKNLVTPDGVDLSHHAFAYYQWALGLLNEDEETLETLWLSCKDRVNTHLSEMPADAASELDELQIQGLQTVVFGMSLMRMFAGEVDADLSALPADDEIDGSLTYLVGHIAETSNASHLDQFLTLAARAAAHDSLEDGEQYRWVHFDGPKEELRINVDLAHDALGKYRREYSVEGIDWLSNVNDYKSRIRELGDDPDSYIASTGSNGLGVPTSGINRAVGFDAELAEEQIEGFERSMFLDGEASDETTINAVEAADPLAAVDNGYQTVTVEVVSTDSPDNPSIAQAGTVRDATMTMDFSTWVRDDEQAPKLEEGKCYCLREAAVEMYSGATKLTLQPGVTEVNEIQQGEGHTNFVEDDADADDTVAVADGGSQ